jgi:hypothetical protein
MPVHTRLLLAALVVAAGGTGGSAQGNQDTQQAWAERRRMQWGGSPPPPPPPPPPTPDSSTVVVSADGAPGSEEGTVQSTTADVPACVVSQGANGNVYRLHGLGSGPYCSGVRVMFARHVADAHGQPNARVRSVDVQLGHIRVQ